MKIKEQKAPKKWRLEKTEKNNKEKTRKKESNEEGHVRIQYILCINPSKLHDS